MEQFLNLVDLILTKGKKRANSTQGVGNYVFPSYEMRFRPAQEFPLITTRSMKGATWRAIVGELLWILSGSSRIEDLHEYGVHIWDQWATPEICARYGLAPGDLGSIYGPQWRHWKTRDGGEIDQISRLVEEIKTFPDSKRMKVIAWNPEDIDKVFIAPCHGDFKCVVAEGEISLNLWQRSCDVLVGGPFNIAEYSLLLLMLAQVTGLKPGEFIHDISDAHIYFNQEEAAREQLIRKPRPLPQVRISPEVKDLFRLSPEDFVLENYEPHPPIKIPVLL